MFTSLPVTKWDHNPVYANSPAEVNGISKPVLIIEKTMHALHQVYWALKTDHRDLGIRG